VSRDITWTSGGFSGTGFHYYATKSVARILDLTLKLTLPDWHEQYSVAFTAGASLPDNPSPFLDRAIIYKLQGRLHKNRHNLGPSISFPVGHFSEQAMLFPQLLIKLRSQSACFFLFLFSYTFQKIWPGRFCIFYSSYIYHKVSKIFPNVQTIKQEEQKITPGRIESIFFFLKESYGIG